MRTPSLRAVRATFRDLQRSRLSGVPMNELADARRAQPRRRDVLRGAVAVACGAETADAIATAVGA